jgi:hypothetical protein
MTFVEIEALVGEALPDAASEWEWWLKTSEGANMPQAAWLDAGFGISSIAYRSADSPGEVVFARGLHRWPTLCTPSWEFGNLPVDERLRLLALGYIRSAKRLCTALGENPSELTWPMGAVVCFCYRHAAELFLKSCIFHREPVTKCDHDISKLRKQYFRLYPHKDFEFQTPYDISFEDIENLCGAEFGIEDFERKHDQVYRYFSEKQGRSPKGQHFFAPGPWLSMIEHLEYEIERIWDRIREQDRRGDSASRS